MYVCILYNSFCFVLLFSGIILDMIDYHLFIYLSVYFSPESVNRSNNSVQIPSTEFSFDAYRFRPLNNQDSIGIRPKNIAKVEPYSMNTNTVRPLYQTTTETTVVPSKARINLNSLGNTPINSSTSSSAGSLGGVIRHSDFLLPNPTYSKPLPNVSSYATSPILLSESLSHQLSTANVPSSNGHTTGLISSKNTSQEKYQSSIQGDFHSSLVRIINRLLYFLSPIFFAAYIFTFISVSTDTNK